LASVAVRRDPRQPLSPATGSTPQEPAPLESTPIDKPRAATAKPWELRGLALAAGIATIALALGAYALTRGGSVDRWWYLAFVRAFLVEDALVAVDPMLGTATRLARFACNSWLAGIAAWARTTGVDPVLIYERAAPVLLAPLALSATASAVRRLLGDRRAGLAAIVIAAAFWTSGGPFPALTRLPEDKLLAALVLAPTLWASIVRIVDATSVTPAQLVVALLAALALATVHPLVFLIAMVTIAPTLLLARPRIAAGVALALLVIGTLPVAIGIGARAQLDEAASIESSEHPVGRIHLSRERVGEADGLLAVDPRLIASPLALLALATLPAIAFRSARERALLVVPAVVALALCFVPLLATLLGRVVTPWMVYRFLWAIPFVPLLAVLARAAAARMPLGYTVPLACMIALAVPAMSATLERRTSTARTQLATPTSEEFRGLVDALRALPATSVVAAAPELSERIPGLAGRHVLAASDRATLVFAGHASGAEARLRDRAALLAGVWRRSEGAPAPTHVLFEPGAPASRYCGRSERLYDSASYALCAFEAREPPPGMKLADAPPAPDDEPVASTRDKGADTTCRFACEPPPERVADRLVVPRPGPWSARAPGVACTVAADSCSVGERSSPLSPRSIELAVVTGRAVEELTILARAERDGAQRWNLRARAIVRDGDALRYALPSGDVDRIEIALVPSRLPFVKLRALALLLGDAGSTRVVP
jgi:hypothetical protein